MTQTPTSPSIYDLSSSEIAKLASLAVEAKSKAYCPYSNFPVGASLLLSSGEYHTGSNVEIASTPVGICAERCCIAPVIAQSTSSYHSSTPDDTNDAQHTESANIPVIIGLAVSTNVDPPASPCGMCRQFIREFCQAEMRIWMYGKKWDEGEKSVVVRTIGELLPLSFGREDLEKGVKKS